MLLRVLTRDDPSVALVCAMHPAVLNFWLATSEAPAPFQKTCEEQRGSIFRNIRAGAWWGTIASELGTAGDIAKTRAAARRGPTDGAYLLTGGDVCVGSTKTPSTGRLPSTAGEP